MINEFDLIAVQEVQDKDNGGADHIAAIVDTLNLTTTSPWSYVVIPWAGRGYPGNEGYSFIYRFPVMLETDVDFNASLFDTKVDYGKRHRVYQVFREGEYYHLQPVNPNRGYRTKHVHLEKAKPFVISEGCRTCVIAKNSIYVWGIVWGRQKNKDSATSAKSLFNLW